MATKTLGPWIRILQSHALLGSRLSSAHDPGPLDRSGPALAPPLGLAFLLAPPQVPQPTQTQQPSRYRCLCLLWPVSPGTPLETRCLGLVGREDSKLRTPRPARTQHDGSRPLALCFLGSQRVGAFSCPRKGASGGTRLAKEQSCVCVFEGRHGGPGRTYVPTL